MGKSLTGVGVVSFTGWTLLTDRGLARVKSTPVGPMILAMAEVTSVPGDCFQALPRVGSSSSLKVGSLGQPRVNLLLGLLRLLILSLVTSWAQVRVLSLILTVVAIKGLSPLARVLHITCFIRVLSF
jgi:hypothetical protein